MDSCTIIVLDDDSQRLVGQLLVKGTTRLGLTTTTLAALVGLDESRVLEVLVGLHTRGLVHDDTANPAHWTVSASAAPALALTLTDGTEADAALVRFVTHFTAYVDHAAAQFGTHEWAKSTSMLDAEHVAVTQWIALATQAEQLPLAAQAALERVAPNWCLIMDLLETRVSLPTLVQLSTGLVAAARRAGQPTVALGVWLMCRSRALYLLDVDSAGAMAAAQEALDTLRRVPLCEQHELVACAKIAIANAHVPDYAAQVPPRACSGMSVARRGAIIWREFQRIRAQGRELLAGQQAAASTPAAIEAVLDAGLWSPLDMLLLDQQPAPVPAVRPGAVLAQPVNHMANPATRALADVLLSDKDAVERLFAHVKVPPEGGEVVAAVPVVPAAASLAAFAGDNCGGGDVSVLCPEDQSLLLTMECQMTRLVVLGNRHFDCVHTWHNIGAYLAARATKNAAYRPMAQRYYLKCLDGLRSCLGPCHPFVVTVLSSIAELLDMEVSLRALSLEVYREVLALRRCCYGPSHVDVARTLSYMAIAMHKLGRFDESLAAFRECLVIRQATVGERHISVAATLNNIAISLNKRDDAAGMLEAYTQCLSIREEVYGRVHPEVAATLDNVAVTLHKLGRLDEAVARWFECVEVHEQLLARTPGASTAELARIKFKLGVGTIQRDASVGVAWFIESLQLRLQAPGMPEVRAALHDMSTILSIQVPRTAETMEPRRRFLTALLVANRVLAAGDGSSVVLVATAATAPPQLPVTALVTEDDVTDANVAACLHGIGGVLYSMGQFAEAQVLHEQCLVLRQRFLRPADSNIAASLYNIGCAAKAQGGAANLAMALERFEESLAVTRSLAPEPTMTAAKFAALVVQYQTSALCGIATVHEERGNWELALRAYTECLGLYPESDTESRLLTMDSIGAAQFNFGNRLAAQQSFAETVALAERLYGDGGGDGAACACACNANKGKLTLAKALYKCAYTAVNMDAGAAPLAALEQALSQFTQCLALLETHGGSQLDIGFTLVSIGDVLQAQGHDALALTRFEAAKRLDIAKVTELADAYCATSATALPQPRTTRGVPWTRANFV